MLDLRAATAETGLTAGLNCCNQAFRLRKLGADGASPVHIMCYGADF